MKLSAKQTASLAVRALLIVAVVFTADRVVKQWCIEVLRPQGSIAFWPGVLHFTYAENTGAAFSILSGRRLLLTLLPIAALGLLLFLYFRRLYAHPLTDFALPLIMGGALGNLLGGRLLDRSGIQAALLLGTVSAAASLLTFCLSTRKDSR